MADHYVVVTRDEDGLARLAAIRPPTDQDRADYYHLAVECATPGGCGGWQECDGDHTGYDPDDEESPAYDQWDGVMIHGVEHEWQYDHVWAIPYIGCPFQEHSEIDTSGISTDTDGRYTLDVDWDDTECYLTALGLTVEEGDRG